jgi:hypothetical protein
MTQGNRAQPAAGCEEFSRIKKIPLPTGGGIFLLSTFYFLLSTFYFLLSTFYFLLSTFYFLLSTFYFIPILPVELPFTTTLAVAPESVPS